MLDRNTHKRAHTHIHKHTGNGLNHSRMPSTVSHSRWDHDVIVAPLQHITLFATEHNLGLLNQSPSFNNKNNDHNKALFSVATPCLTHTHTHSSTCTHPGLTTTVVSLYLYPPCYCCWQISHFKYRVGGVCMLQGIAIFKPRHLSSDSKRSVSYQEYFSFLFSQLLSFFFFLRRWILWPQLRTTLLK